MSLCLSRLVWSDSHPNSETSLSMLHNLVVPLMILAASMWIVSNCFLVVALLYSSNDLVVAFYESYTDNG